MKLNWRLFIPFLMLMLAALACDQAIPKAIEVKRVYADPDTAGRVYAEVIGIDAPVIYQSDDYGQSWQRTQSDFPPVQLQQYPLTFKGETLYRDETALWSFPRRTFRFFFYDDDNAVQPRFALPSGEVSNSAANDTLYVAMGTEGVLIASVAADGSFHDWRLSSTGLDLLQPLPLTITAMLPILGVALMALLIPPLPFIHAYFLYSVWIYVLPKLAARRWALGISLFLSLVMVGINAIWLTNVNADFYGVVAVMSVICVLGGVGATYYLSAQSVIPATRYKLMIAAALSSLMVPLGMVGIYTLWWLVFIVLIGCFTLRWAYSQHLGKGFEPTPEGRQLRWRIDRLVLETLGILVMLSIAIFVIGTLIRWLLLFGMPFRNDDLFLLIQLAVGLVLGMWLVRVYLTRRLSSGWEAKQGAAEVQLRLKPLIRDVRIAAVGWFALTVIASVAVFVVQVGAYSWFTTLLRG